MKYEIQPVYFNGNTYIRVDDDKKATFFGLYKDDDEWICDCKDRKTAEKISCALEYYEEARCNITFKKKVSYDKRIL